MRKNNTERLPILSEPKEELDLDFACLLDKNWGNSKFFLLSIHHFSKFPSAKVANNTSVSSLLSFMSHYCHLYGYPKSIRADHGSCFISNDFENVCEKNNINLILCTVGDHRSNRVVKRLVYTIKAKLMAMSFNEPEHRCFTQWAGSYTRTMGRKKLVNYNICLPIFK